MAPRYHPKTTHAPSNRKSPFIAASGEKSNGMRFNIGTGRGTTDRDLHSLVAEAAQAPDNPHDKPARLGDVPRSSLDNTLTKETLDWEPQVTLEEGVHAPSRSSVTVATRR